MNHGQESVLLLKPPAAYIRKTKLEVEAAGKKWQEMIDEDRFNTLRSTVDHAFDFAKRHGLIVFGGHAINALLPESEKIYKKKEINDVDMLSFDPKNHAVKFASELDDVLGVPWAQVRNSFMHDNSFTIIVRGTKIVDFNYMPKASIDHLFLKVNRNLRPMAPIEFLLSSMHLEFSSSLITPHRWAKTFERFVKLLKENPIEHVSGCLTTCFREADKEEAKLIMTCHRELKQLVQGGEHEASRPIVGASAVGFFADPFGKIPKTKIPLCQLIPVIEVLSIDPMGDAARVAKALQQTSNALEIKIVRRGLWLNDTDHHHATLLKATNAAVTPPVTPVTERNSHDGDDDDDDDQGDDDDAHRGGGKNKKKNKHKNKSRNGFNNLTMIANQSDNNKDVTFVEHKKAIDGQPMDEAVITVGSDNLSLISFIRSEKCNHFVKTSSGNIIGGIDTVMTCLYKRSLFDDAVMGNVMSPVNAMMRCMISTMYDVQFDMTERKRTKTSKRFSVSECYGISLSFHELSMQQNEKQPSNRFYYFPYLPVEREKRRIARLQYAQNNKPPVAPPKGKVNTHKASHKKPIIASSTTTK